MILKQHATGRNTSRRYGRQQKVKTFAEDGSMKYWDDDDGLVYNNLILAHIGGMIIGRPPAPIDCDVELCMKYVNGHLVGTSLCKANDSCEFAVDEYTVCHHTHNLDIVFE
jgi:hypothetical protein